MKKYCILIMILFVIFIACGCTTPLDMNVEFSPTEPVPVILVEPETEPGVDVEPVPLPDFKYVLVQETNYYYLHKLDSWSVDDGAITFTCPVCGNTIRIAEENAILYEKVNLQTAWADYADVCGGDATNWHDLLAE